MEDNCKELCYEGETVYRLTKNTIMETKVVRIEHYPHCVYKLKDCPESYFNRAFGKSLFKTYEEANAMIQKKNNIATKRELLRKYEAELNEKFNLGDHKFIK